MTNPGILGHDRAGIIGLVPGFVLMLLLDTMLV